MPTATRQHATSRRAVPRGLPRLAATSSDDGVSGHAADAQGLMPDAGLVHDEDADPGGTVELDDGDMERDEEESVDDGLVDAFPPPGLKEISSLASWTVSSAKPGNGVAALRSPDPAHFWQSDGPQPHCLSIHFFKLVSIVSIRILLSYANDESYTPTKIQFLAGMGAHDMQEFAEMTFDQPNGWQEVDFSNVGPVEPESDDEAVADEIDWSKRPVLRAFLFQVRILENHQNGKDTHVRGLQIFARDDELSPRKTSMSSMATRLATTSNASIDLAKRWNVNSIKLAPWMMEPNLR